MKKNTLIFLFFIAIYQLPLRAQQIIIIEGDTLSKIANDYNISVSSIIDANKLDNADQLSVGQKIDLPKGAIRESLSKNIKHIVSKGETISYISKKYSVNKNDIIYLNNLKNPDLLYPGQTLFLS